MSINYDVLEILRCPFCVNDEARKHEDNPGQLKLVHNDSWLICQETGCDRKYPIKEGIPVMLIAEGDKWVDTTVKSLPETGKFIR